MFWTLKSRYSIVSFSWYFYFGIGGFVIYYGTLSSGCFWASQILGWIPTSSVQSFLCFFICVLMSHIYAIDVLDTWKSLLHCLSSWYFYFCIGGFVIYYGTLSSRCSWVSQTLGWNLTSSVQSFPCFCIFVLMSHINTIDVFETWNSFLHNHFLIIFLFSYRGVW